MTTVAHMHFSRALANHMHDICVEENDLPTKQQTEDRANSKPRSEQIFFSTHEVQSFATRECGVVRKCDVIVSPPACSPYKKKLDQLPLVGTGTPRHDITVNHEIRMRYSLRRTQLAL